MASINESVPALVYYDAYVADCDEGVEFKGENNTAPQLNEPSQLNVDPITDIHVAQSESNEMSHEYHAQNGVSDEVVVPFSNKHQLKISIVHIQIALILVITKYAMTQPEFFHHYRELQEDNPHDTTWLDQIPRKQWTLAWDDRKRWGHMTTNLAKTTHEKLNKYFVDRGTQAYAMIASGQVYALIAAKFITKEETKFQFQVEERVNRRERCRMGKLTVRMDQRTCDYGKPQKLHMSCAHVIAACKHNNIDYLQYVSPMYTLNYVSSVYKVLLACMHHHDYWPPYERSQLCVNTTMRRNKKG
ncbi:hypothetical protein HKD37_14G039888 [Glycine soja]